jgi:multidrug efflux pump subunit AcrA (membrane-fusion protein)
LETNNFKIYTQEPISIKKTGIEIEDIISTSPPFIVRFGTFIFLVLLILVTTIFWFIQYPDLIQIPAELASINSPIQVKSVTNGRLLLLNVKENEKVSKGKVIGVIGSKGNHDQILQLSAIIDSLAHKLNNSSSRIKISLLNDITFVRRQTNVDFWL